MAEVTKNTPKHFGIDEIIEINNDSYARGLV